MPRTTLLLIRALALAPAVVLFFVAAGCVAARVPNLRVEYRTAMRAGAAEEPRKAAPASRALDAAMVNRVVLVNESNTRHPPETEVEATVEGRDIVSAVRPAGGRRPLVRVPDEDMADLYNLIQESGVFAAAKPADDPEAEFARRPGCPWYLTIEVDGIARTYIHMSREELKRYPDLGPNPPLSALHPEVLTHVRAAREVAPRVESLGGRFSSLGVGAYTKGGAPTTGPKVGVAPVERITDPAEIARRLAAPEPPPAAPPRPGTPAPDASPASPPGPAITPPPAPVPAPTPRAGEKPPVPRGPEGGPSFQE
ncbi:MAG: hypothetical protein HY719_06435 [Planctomycetes bacterium]|nr:hypothetical protein [Planctomycetota bacterium]